MIVIRRCTFEEIDASGLLSEYAQESAICGLPAPAVQMEMYNAMEAVGIICPLGAYLENILIGGVTLLSPVLPHYGVKVGVTESFFVSKKWRKTGAGLKLLNAAEVYAKEIGCAGLLVSAPVGGDLDKVLPRRGYRESNRVFFKSV